MKKVGKQRYEIVWGGQLAADGRNIALQMNELPLNLAIPPEAEAVAIRVDQIRQGLELRPLLPVMLVSEAAGIGPLAGRLYLNEADQGVVARDGIVGPRLEIGERGFSDRHDSARRQSREFGDVRDERLQGSTQLILWCAARSRV